MARLRIQPRKPPVFFRRDAIDVVLSSVESAASVPAADAEEFSERLLEEEGSAVEELPEAEGSSTTEAEATKNSSTLPRGRGDQELEGSDDGRDGEKGADDDEEEDKERVVEEDNGGGGLSSGSSSKLVGVEPVAVKVMLPGPPMNTG